MMRSFPTRDAAPRAGIRIEVLTLAWMALESLLAFGSGWAEYAAAVLLLFWLARETGEAFESAKGDERANGEG